MSTVSENSGGIGLCGLLTVAFIILKLCHVIDWKWFWVLSPTLIPLIIGVGILIIFGLIAALFK